MGRTLYTGVADDSRNMIAALFAVPWRRILCGCPGCPWLWLPELRLVSKQHWPNGLHCHYDLVTGLVPKHSVQKSS